MHPKGRGRGSATVLLLLLLLAFVATAAHLVPRLSFRKEDPRRLVSSFSHKEVQNYDVFLLSPDGETLFVGAREAILALDITRPGDIQVKGEIPWSPPASKKEECVFKKKSNETECFNFLRVLVPLNATHLYACGTYAFSPTCAFLDVANFTLVKDAKGNPLLQEGKGICPFDPRHQNTAIVVDGELYAGTMNNFQGNEPIISRTLGTRTPLKTDSFLTWLHPDASFVGSFSPAALDPEAEEGKVYFFFSETGKEFDFFERLTVPRVARVCKNDVGGDKVLQKKWTTFLKAGLSCSQGNGHFPFTLLRHVAPLHQPQGGATLLYGVFASQWQGGSSSSAVCAFSLSSIQRAFEGKYKELNKDCSRWVTYSGPPMEPRPGSCGVGPSSDKALTFMKDHFLMEGRVAPVLGRPLLVAHGTPYSRLALHHTRLASGKTLTVLFLGTEGGSLHKAVSLDGSGGEAHIVEEVQLFERPEPVRNLLLDPTQGRLFVGHSRGVLEVPWANCSQHRSCAQCVLARDPFCAWDGERCRDLSRDGADGDPQNRTRWAQDVEGGRPGPLCPPIGSSGSSASAKGRSGPRSSLPVGLPVTELRGPVHSLLRLPCPRASALANYSWTLPAATPPWAALVVPEEEAGGALLSGGGGLVVLVGREPRGPFACWASENGFRHPVALFRVLPVSAPSFSGEGDRPELSGAAGKGPGPEPMSERRSYWVQFVTVTVLLAMTLSVAAALAFFSFYEKVKAKSKVDHTGGPEGGQASGQEKAPLQSSQAAPPESSSGGSNTKSCCVQVDIDAENNRLTTDKEEEDGGAKPVAAVAI
ncbi:semaphorin-4A [Anolis carolinensis]|uniref:semaphorin-4A n=1 Tax=Anolis carolinensis TaxID=28377 RepID=UPI002F2B878C